MTDEQAERMMAGYSEFELLPIAVHDEFKDIAVIEARIRQYVEEGPVAGIVIDHAQEIEVPRGRSRHEEVAMIAVRFRDLAEKLGIPIMLLSQTTFKDGNYEPQYSRGLREKSSLCLVVSRGKPGATREVAVQSNVTRIICDKSRWEPAPPPLILIGDVDTGRLSEQEEYERLQAAEGGSWRNHDNG